MTKQPITLDELFAEDEVKRLADARKEQAAEDAAWAALPEEEKARILAEREAKWAAIEDQAEGYEEAEDEEDGDDDE